MSHLRMLSSGRDESGMIRPLQSQDPGDQDQDPNQGSLPFSVRIRRALRLVMRDFKDSFSNPYVLKWSVWWALGMCGNFQVKHEYGCQPV